MSGDIPQISGMGYTNTSTPLTSFISMVANQSTSASSYIADLLNQQADLAAMKQQPQPQKEKQMATARIVKVFIADPAEQVPLESRVLYTGPEKLTDLTDQELFFEVPIKEIVDKHNEFRKTVIDKKASEKAGREIKLDAVKIRDLKMVVVSIAEF